MDIKRRRKSTEVEEEGAISKLPEELLWHILSFLSTKEATLASVVSKTWRNLVTSIPSLHIDLDDSRFALGDRPEGCNQETLDLYTSKFTFDDRPERTSFMEFVNRLFALRSDSPITKFSLVCDEGVDECLINDWITKALRLGATDLTLMLFFPSRLYSLPPSIYLYGQNLVKLKLGRGDLSLLRCDRFPKDFIFAKLRTLHLDSHSNKGGTISGGKTFARILSKCPVLEELIVNCMNWHIWKPGSSLSSPTLKRLTIDCDPFPSRIYSGKELLYIFYGTSKPVSVSFDTPNLLYLNYADYVARKYPLVRLDSLVEARLDIGLTRDQMSERDKNVHRVHCDATNFIMGIHNVQTLELTSDTLEVISDYCDTVPVFHNLSHLSIESNERGWQGLPLLLINCPNLHTLVFHGLHHGVTDGCGDACDCRSPSPSLSSSCLSSCPVKVLKILEFGATCAEMSLVEHFLNKLTQLEQVIIVLNFDSVQEENLDLFKVSSALEMAPRASPNCNLKVLND